MIRRKVQVVVRRKAFWEVRRKVQGLFRRKRLGEVRRKAPAERYKIKQQ